MDRERERHTQRETERRATCRYKGRGIKQTWVDVKVKVKVEYLSQPPPAIGKENLCQ